MLFLLSPAKSLDYETPAPRTRATEPQFIAESAALIELLKARSESEIADLMSLSEPLAALNAHRYAAWQPRSTTKNSRPAAYAFNGDVYGGLDARSLSPADMAWAQKHVAILSGLYGVLRPLDRLQPYRLEMGTALATPRGKDLYAFWGDTIAQHLNARMAGETSPVIVNLASQEYFRAADRPALRPRVVDCVFEEWKDGRYKVISFFAKRARGLMARFAIQKRLRSPLGLRRFDAEGYTFDAGASDDHRLVFRRHGA